MFLRLRLRARLSLIVTLLFLARNDDSIPSYCAIPVKKVIVTRLAISPLPAVPGTVRKAALPVTGGSTAIAMKESTVTSSLPTVPFLRAVLFLSHHRLSTQ